MSGFLLRACRLILNLFLTLLLFVQAAILFAGFIDVPEIAIEQLQKQLRTEGFEADFQAVRVDFPGGITISELQILSIETDETLVSAQYGRIRISPRRWLRDRQLIGKLQIDDAAVYLPARLSQTGKRETFLKSMHLTMQKKSNHWKINSFQAKSGNLSASASGEIPLFPEKEREPIDWQKKFKEAAPEIVRIFSLLKRAEDPEFKIEFSALEDGSLKIEADGFSRKVRPIRELVLLNPKLSASLDYDGTEWRAKSGSFSIRKAVWQKELTAENLRGKIDWPSRPADWIPQTADLFASELKTGFSRLDSIQTKIERQKELELKIDLFAFFEEGPIDLQADLDAKTGDGNLSLLTRINPTSILQHEIAKQLGLRRDLFFRNPIQARGRATFENWDFHTAKANASARTNGADADGVSLDSIQAELIFANNSLQIPHLSLTAEDFSVKGSYEYDLRTKEYRFLFDGNLRPLHISPWFRDWWIGLWENFDFTGPPLKGDVEIRSILGKSENVRIVGSAEASDFFLKGVPVDNARMNLFILHDYADIFDLEIERKEGSANGSFQYRGNQDGPGFKKINFDIDSTLDPADVAQLFDEAGRNILSSFRFSTPPHLRLGGILHESSQSDQTKISFSGRTSEPLTYENIPLTSLTVDGHLEGDKLILPRFNGVFSGGSFDGYAQKWTEQDDEKLEFAIQLENADLTEAIESVKTWQKAAGIVREEEIVGTDIGGSADLDITLQGDYGDIWSFSGEGDLQIRDADLAEVHLLGMLSRLLDSTPLGFTSLQFDQADATFQIENEKMHVSDLRLTGSTSAITGSGDYIFTEDTIDFLIKLHFMQESKIPLLSLLLAPVFEPLARVLEIRLAGSLGEPEWRFLLGPRNILENISTTNETDKESKSDSKNRNPTAP